MRMVNKRSRKRRAKDTCRRDFQVYGIVVEFRRHLTATMGADLYTPAMAGSPSPDSGKKVEMLDAQFPRR